MNIKIDDDLRFKSYFLKKAFPDDSITSSPHEENTLP